MRPILTAAAMREAEQAAIDAGTSIETLMERAGAALAEAVYRFAGKLPVLILAGPGNNGGDGYVAARHLTARGISVRIAALAEPKSAAAMWAKGEWGGEVEVLSAETRPAPILIDALFGTRLTRGLDEQTAIELNRLAEKARAVIACDLPSGVDTDSGSMLSAIPDYDLTVTFGAMKPAHRLMPSMARCGRLVVADIGIQAASDWHEIGEPRLPPLDPAGHKFSRGLVHMLAGKMPGAIALSAAAAARAGAGYVRVSTSRSIDNLPSAIVQTDTAEINDERIGCLLVGPGMGDIPQVLTLALTSHAPKVIDADALNLLSDAPRSRSNWILTPHPGEAGRMLGISTAEVQSNRLQSARELAKRFAGTVVLKGAGTLVVTDDCLPYICDKGNPGMASPGMGDVLTGVIAGIAAQTADLPGAARAGVLVHAMAGDMAARRALRR